MGKADFGVLVGFEGGGEELCEESAAVRGVDGAGYCVYLSGFSVSCFSGCFESGGKWFIFENYMIYLSLLRASWGNRTDTRIKD